MIADPDFDARRISACAMSAHVREADRNVRRNASIWSTLALVNAERGVSPAAHAAAAP